MIRIKSVLLAFALALGSVPALADEDWPQFKYDARHSGNARDRSVKTPLSLVGAVPLSDGIYTSPVIADGRVYVVDGSGKAFCIDTKTLETVWTFQSPGGKQNCNNVSSPVIAGKYLHFGTMSGYYVVLDRGTGRAVKERHCGDPIFSAPIAGKRRVYFSTLGSQIYAVEPDGTVVWMWDFVKEHIGFKGNRWSGADWLKHKGGRVTWREHFVCSRNISLSGDRTVVIPAGGRTVFLEDAGEAPKVRAVVEIPSYAGREYPATFGQSVGDEGEVYVQWHRRDNAGRTEIIRIQDGKVKTSFVPGTETAIHLDGLLSFASVSVRGKDVYRVKPERGRGLMKHSTAGGEPKYLGGYPSICPPVLLKDQAVYGGLDGSLYVVPLSGEGPLWSFKTAFGSPITAPVAVADGRIYVPSEDGYLYVLGSDGKAALPDKDLEVWKIRSPLTGPLADSKYDWYTNYGDFGCTNANDQGLAAPLRMRWVRRIEGTVKHNPVGGGGRLYTHIAEGQIIAVEQDTGRLLWRRYWPDVYLSFTSPLYYRGKLIVPQAGLKRSRMRCLDAATGRLIWETPFTGTPGWSRQFPPVVHEKVAIYAAASGRYSYQGSEKYFTFKGAPKKSPDGKEVMSFIYSNTNPYYPKDQRPRLWAWDLETGKLVWEKDFSEYGRGGNDNGIAIMDGRLFYSTFFGYAASQKARRGLPAENNGLTACLDPKTGEVIWKTTKYHVTSKCTVTAKNGRVYLGGYNRAKEGTKDRFVWCLDAKDGSLVWKSEAVTSALNVVTVGDRFMFSNALRGKGNVFDVKTGKVVSSVGHNYACCRFTLSEPFVLGANMDMIDLSGEGKLVSTGPAIDSRECLGAVVSNGRIFYTSQASGFQVSQVYGKDARALKAAWEK